MNDAFKKALSKSAETGGTVSTKKSKGPVITLPKDGADAKALDEFVTNKQTWKQAETVMKSAEAQLLPVLQKRQDDDAYKGQFNGSYDVTNGKTTVKFITQDKFVIASTDEAVAQLKKTVTKEQFEKLVTETFSIKIKDEVLADEKLQEKLMKLIGKEFDTFFQVTTKLTATDDLNRRIFEIVPREKLDDVRQIVVRYKPSLRS